MAARTIEALVHLIATVSPGAKLGSTAPHSFAHLVLAESGNRQPCTLANAFLGPVAANGALLTASYAKMASEIHDLDTNFGSAPQRRLMARGAPVSISGATQGSLPELAAWCAQQVQ